MSFLRNLNNAPGGKRILGTPFVGIEGALVPSTGYSGASLLANDVLEYGLGTSLVRCEVLSHNLPAGTLYVYEDSSFDVIGAPDGVYTLYYRLWINGVLSSVDIGYGPGVGVATIKVGTGVVLPVPVLLPWSVFSTYVLPFVPGCPDDMVTQAARQASIEWFQRTLCWRTKLPAVSAVSGYSTYPMPLPSHGALAKLLGYFIDGERANVVNVERGDAMVEWGTNADAAWTSDRTTFTVAPEPAAGQQLVLDVALKPTQAAQGIYEHLWEQYAEQLQNGTLYRLFAMPNQPWTDAQRSAYFKSLFDGAVSTVGIAASKAFARSRLRSAAQFF